MANYPSGAFVVQEIGQMGVGSSKEVGKTTGVYWGFKREPVNKVSPGQLAWNIFWSLFWLELFVVDLGKKPRFLLFLTILVIITSNLSSSCW